jgi:hypothetical protein
MRKRGSDLLADKFDVDIFFETIERELEKILSLPIGDERKDLKV